MRSAWLDCGERWTRTTDPDTVLEHQGPMIVCDDEEDERLIHEKIANETGKFTVQRYHSIMLSDVPVFDSLCDEA